MYWGCGAKVRAAWKFNTLIFHAIPSGNVVRVQCVFYAHGTSTGGRVAQAWISISFDSPGGSFLQIVMNKECEGAQYALRHAGISQRYTMHHLMKKESYLRHTVLFFYCPKKLDKKDAKTIYSFKAYSLRGLGVKERKGLN